MKRSITKSHRRRIEQSSQSIMLDVLERQKDSLDWRSRLAIIDLKNQSIQFVKRLCVTLAVAFAVLCFVVGFTSCNVTRVITNESQYFQRGDTSVVIQTKTTETYDASKKL